ncbi:MAG: hypothetical protein J6A75_06220 [Lachnospiraceae bacterium]|nr:hypothetical protein [Lachnospiraceae bacterium]
MSNYNLRVFNGCNHPINFYSKNYAQNRKTQFFLTTENALPDKIYSQGNPLSAYSYFERANPCCGINLFFPEMLKARLDIASNYYEYDIILVSSRYAALAKQVFFNNPDYLDRLFCPITLYNRNPEESNQNSLEKAKKIGCIGFRKVWSTKTPQNYMAELRAGYYPSVASMQICQEIFRQYPYLDPETKANLDQLQAFLMQFQ